MNIGIDLRALQTGHKFRGIGEVAKQVTNRVLSLAAAEKDAPHFVFYEYDDDDPKELLSLPKEISYDVVKLGPMPEGPTVVGKKETLKRHAADMYGSPVRDSSKVDVFLQFDYAFGVPSDTKTLLVKHDLIPLVFWKQFFESPLTHIRNKAARTTLRTAFNNHKYKRVLKRSVRNADGIISVSQSTKNDLKKYLGVPDRKIQVVHLGVDMSPAKTKQTVKATLPTKPYMLFIGAGDQRRKVEDAVHAFNNLKAQGVDIQLVLAGENFQSAEKIPNPSLRKAVASSSYSSDILTLGYIDDQTKQTLFQNAIAYVYPTLYEGFGIPILEAMLLGCPVIVYANSSTQEVGGADAVYVDDWKGIALEVKRLLDEPQEVRAKQVARARRHAEAFSWDNTAQAIYRELQARA